MVKHDAQQIKLFLLVSVFLLSITSLPVLAESGKALFTYRSLSVEMAQLAVNKALQACKKKGYSVAVALVDRGGNLQAFARDRFAGPHTPETAIRKAWTANSFRQDTTDLAVFLKKGQIPNQVQHNPGALLVGGGVKIEAQGELLGGIGVAGAPPGSSERDSIDGRCAKAGLEAVREAIEFSD